MEKVMETVDEMLDGREVRYGSFAKHAEICQNLKAQLVLCDKWCVLDDTKREALEMICHKMARVLNGDPDYADNWVDIAGYAQLVVRDLQDTKRG